MAAKWRLRRVNVMTNQRRHIDDAAFGFVYGSITVMAFLMAVHRPIEEPGRLALVLFGTVVAVAVAKAYAEICERTLQSGNAADWAAIRASWQHTQTVLLAANGPALALALSAAGLWDPEFAFALAQLFAIGALSYFGARIGWRVRRRIGSAIVGASVTGGLGLSISLLKHTMH